MRKLIRKPDILSVILITFLSLPLSLISSSIKDGESEGHMTSPSQTGETLPVELLEIIIEYAGLPSFPAFARVCKDTNRIVQPKIFVAKDFFDRLYKNDCDFNSWYHYARQHGYKNNKEAFKAGFPALIFERVPKSPQWERDIVLPAYQITRSYLKEDSKFSPDIQKAYPEIFSEAPSKGPLKWDYFKVFQLDQKSREPRLEHYFLCKMYMDFLKLKNFLEISQDARNEICTIEDMKRRLFEHNQETLFDPIVRNLRVLFKYILLQKEGSLENFLKNLTSLEALQLMQEIPVDLSTYKEEISPLFEKTEALILKRAQERWELVSLLKAYLSIG